MFEHSGRMDIVPDKTLPLIIVRVQLDFGTEVTGGSYMQFCRVRIFGHGVRAGT
jgi:hypothetical protein